MKLHPYPPPLGLASVICSKMGIGARSGQPEVSLSLLLKLLGKKTQSFHQNHKLQRYEPGAINSHLCHNIRKACLRTKPAQMKDENRFLRLLVRFLDPAVLEALRIFHLINEQIPSFCLSRLLLLLTCNWKEKFLTLFIRWPSFFQQTLTEYLLHSAPCRILAKKTNMVPPVGSLEPHGGK